MRGAEALYRAMLTEADDLRALATARPLSMPVLAAAMLEFFERVDRGADAR